LKEFFSFFSPKLKYCIYFTTHFIFWQQKRISFWEILFTRLPLEGKLSSASETDEVFAVIISTSSTAKAVPLPLKGKAKKRLGFRTEPFDLTLFGLA